MIAFGPVPYKRLGRSLGINNIPPKICTYSCVYCQVASRQGIFSNTNPPAWRNLGQAAFAYTGRVEEDLLSITAVHPMRRSAVKDFLEKAAAGWSVVRQLMAQNKLVETAYEGQKFYLRNFL